MIYVIYILVIYHIVIKYNYYSNGLTVYENDNVYFYLNYQKFMIDKILYYSISLIKKKTFNSDNSYFVTSLN